ncbi:MAG: sugar kinase [Lachnospiraceae bacterium]|nr:sugar kinase [Lachnospiraceae bacterium]
MSEMKNCEVVVVGGSHTDLQIFTVDRDLFDAPSYSVQEMLLTVGGDSLNESTIITRLGHSVRLVSCIGDDRIAGVVLDHCKENGIDTSYVKLDPTKTTSINVGLIFKDAERVFINNRAGSIWTLCPDDINLDALAGGKILSFASIFNNPLLDGRFMVKLFKRAKEENMLICADIVSAKNGETLEDIREGLSYIDYLFPNIEEARKLTGKEDVREIAQILLDCGVKNVVIKIGKDGCYIRNKDGEMTVGVYKHCKPIESTGAGDNFASGFIAGLLEGKSLHDCAVMANCAASIAVEHIGAVAGLKERSDLDERVRRYVEEGMQ